MEEVLAEPVVRTEEDVRPIAARDRGLELREIAGVGDAQERDGRAVLLLEALGDRSERELLAAALLVGMPDDDATRGLFAAEDRETEGEKEDQCASHATPVFESNRCTREGAAASGIVGALLYVNDTEQCNIRVRRYGGRNVAYGVAAE